MKTFCVASFSPVLSPTTIVPPTSFPNASSPLSSTDPSAVIHSWRGGSATAYRRSMSRSLQRKRTARDPSREEATGCATSLISLQKKRPAGLLFCKGTRDVAQPTASSPLSGLIPGNPRSPKKATRRSAIRISGMKRSYDDVKIYPWQCTDPKIESSKCIYRSSVILINLSLCLSLEFCSLIRFLMHYKMHFEDCCLH
ncbi:hypothetical protein MRB53_019295 [Persea americana]|uniref:Uncharacterized protein n=1 Tax=Persea americana TaxID=3435 RepID=A0ACC2KYE0_PERAE|nr:hypothetical protein MRB53_019295 [Persea americana]